MDSGIGGNDGFENLLVTSGFKLARNQVGSG